MSGKGYYIEHDGVESAVKRFDSMYFDAFLFGLYAQPNFLSVDLIDTVLWSLFKFLQGVIKAMVQILYSHLTGFQHYQIIIITVNLTTIQQKLT